MRLCAAAMLKAFRRSLVSQNMILKVGHSLLPVRNEVWTMFFCTMATLLHLFRLDAQQPSDKYTTKLSLLEKLRSMNTSESFLSTWKWSDFCLGYAVFIRRSHAFYS